MDQTGNLYGTTVQGGTGPCTVDIPVGCGTVFKLDASGNETVLHSFTSSSDDGGVPAAGLVMDQGGNLYGTTNYGGAGSCNAYIPGCGTVFKLDASGNETVLHKFTNSSGDGGLPEGNLIMDAAGNLYGTTAYGGSGTCNTFLPGCGIVFKLDTSGNETVLHSFTGSPDGAFPEAGLIMDTSGKLYGTTGGGGAFGFGTVFKLDPAGTETVLHSFTGNDGANPDAGLIVDTVGNLYGATPATLGGAGTCTGPSGIPGCGIVFKLDASGNETVLHSFTGSPDGQTPNAALIMDKAGNLYGTTRFGGASGNCPTGCGTVFKLTIQAPPTIASTSPTSAIAGGAAFTLTVNGTNFVNGSTINFNGNALATTFMSATQLAAVIPASDIATAGIFNITVTNPSGQTSNALSFTVVTPQQATQAITDSVNALFSQGAINGGQDNSLLAQLQHAITMMNAGKNAGAIGNLDSFISEVNDLLSSGVLTPSRAASLISAAQSVIAAI